MATCDSSDSTEFKPEINFDFVAISHYPYVYFLFFKSEIGIPSLPNKPILSNKWPFFTAKIIQFFQSLAWLSGLCVLHLGQCQVQSKDRVTMATPNPKRRFWHWNWSLKEWYGHLIIGN